MIVCVIHAHGLFKRCQWTSVPHCLIKLFHITIEQCTFRLIFVVVLCGFSTSIANVASIQRAIQFDRHTLWFSTWNKNQKSNTERKQKQNQFEDSRNQWNMSPTISAAKKGAKSSGRQTNNSLSSISGHVTIESASKANDSKQLNRSASSGKSTDAKKANKVPNSKTNAKTEKKAARNSAPTVPQKASSSSV